MTKRRLAIAAVLVVLLVLTVVRVMTPPPPPVYSGRAIVGSVAAPGRLHTIANRVTRAGSEIPEEIRRTHIHVADRALLVRSAEVLDSPAFFSGRCGAGAPAAQGPWSFEGVALTAFATQGVKDKTQLFMTQWIQSGDEALTPLRDLWNNGSGAFPLAGAPLRTLAVVNRLDLARVTADGKLDGAEIRFVFGAIPRSDPVFTVIFEFVLRPVDKPAFRSLAGRWNDLAALSGEKYRTELTRVLDSYVPAAGSVRLRVNAMTASGSVWEFRQYQITAGGFQPAPLDQQPKVGPFDPCYAGDSELGTFAKANISDILRYTHKFTGSPMRTCVARIADGAGNVLTLRPDVVPADQLEKARFSLSISSCVGCHSLETQKTPSGPARFDQVKFRDCGHDSRLSNFLTGTEDSTPGLGTWHVPPARGCGLTGPTYEYNDLLRRHLYLYTVLNDLKDTEDSAVWRELLEKRGYTALAAH